ncbi:MAG: hypothetical protein A2X61_04985 [Ignavibacteria bacterium GWB2_35_12]|nr:MAG: hypothetical protein A2X63_11125 [Ignavibacteria bacterium GWA2_35_8]OGU41299.1 MAG: hypothetical protein A2X61_04985 [Ignavibacteria bacterium GWB2_35_12]OGU94607.1 MAG: hypothetical protein A2220_04155 [Ignavibacteria bacterium RIFOXYA2_FULL_35_10]OGV23944.1 MAG: hypothetical protein A2475_02775 [Ignavibacteria bacterium RIFOXYC2_FULL_35_21]
MKIQGEGLAEIVKDNPNLLNFLDRLDVQLGFGDKTIEQICKSNHIEIPFFVEMLQLILKRYEFNPRYIDEFEPKLTVKYLRNSHKSFLNDYLSEIERYIESLKNNETNRKKDCDLMMNYFQDYKTEFVNHLQYEDNTIFPYIIELEKIISENIPNSKIIEKIKIEPINNYIKDHGSLNEQLNDLKYLIIKYFKPFKETKIVRSLIKVIYELEEDLEIHELIENQILFPQTKKMEDKVLKNAMINRK